MQPSSRFITIVTLSYLLPILELMDREEENETQSTADRELSAPSYGSLAFPFPRPLSVSHVLLWTLPWRTRTMEIQATWLS